MVHSNPSDCQSNDLVFITNKMYNQSNVFLKKKRLSITWLHIATFRLKQALQNSYSFTTGAIEAVTRQTQNIKWIQFLF